MKLYTIETGFFKLDGGAMFGIVPKSLWSKKHPADERNLCTWAMRCLLIEEGNRLILVDTGIGDKQDERFFRHYFLHGDASLEGSLKAHGFSRQDITDVLLTHLHFDHCGGAIRREGDRLSPAFPNARYWSSEAHWKWATINPNPREKNSFLRDNILPIQESGMLHFQPEGAFADGLFDLRFVNGHTEAQMLPFIPYKDTKICYMADLIPSIHHVPTAWVMGYDVRPLMTMEEKERLLEEIADNDWVLMFEHDAHHECCRLIRTEKGIRAGEPFQLADL